MKIYLASPLFSSLERRMNELLSERLEEFSTVYLPQRDGPLIEKDATSPESAMRLKQLAFASDIESLQSCSIVVAVLDGRALDEGVCIEMGYAKALGKKIIGVKTDIRTVLPWGNNPMVEGCVDVWVNDLNDLAEAVRSLENTAVL